MNIYILCGTKTGWLPVHMLCKQLPIKGIIGLCDTKTNRQNNEYLCYEDFCKNEGIEYIPMQSYTMKNDEDKKRIKELDIDVVLVASWQRLVPGWFIEHCKIGVVGSHGSPLGISKGRGRSPQNWAMMLGCKDFTLSIFWIDVGIDSGNVIDVKSFSYADTDDIFTSYIKFGIAMADMMIDSYHNGALRLKNGQVQEETECRYLPKRTAEDGMIDWSRPADRIYDFIRALGRPYPGAYTTLNDKKITVWQAKPLQQEMQAAASPGQVLLAFPDGEVLVQCGKGMLVLCEISSDAEKIAEGSVFSSATYKEQMKNIAKKHEAEYPNLPISELVLDEI